MFCSRVLFATGADTTVPETPADVVKITRSWVLPATLREISAIEVTASGKIACLQSQVGSIYIFNIETGLVDKEILFGPPGAYEGLALVNGDAYIACADGRIIEVAKYMADSPSVKEYGTHLTIAEKLDGLCYDRRNKRLLATVKGSADAIQQFKGIYAFSLTHKRMPVKPVIKIDLRHRVFGVPSKNIQNVFQPSDLDIHPTTGQLFIIDGDKRQLLTMRMPDNIRTLRALDNDKFFQPEGVTFTPSGELFIASKGNRDLPGMLLQVEITSN